MCIKRELINERIYWSIPIWLPCSHSAHTSTLWSYHTAHSTHGTPLPMTSSLSIPIQYKGKMDSQGEKWRATLGSQGGFSHCSPFLTLSLSHLCVVVAAVFKFHVSIHFLDTEEVASYKYYQRWCIGFASVVERRMYLQGCARSLGRLEHTMTYCACVACTTHWYSFIFANCLLPL